MGFEKLDSQEYWRSYVEKIKKDVVPFEYVEHRKKGDKWTCPESTFSLIREAYDDYKSSRQWE